MTSQGGTELSYDGRGNVISVGSAAFGYSSENRLTATNASGIRYEPLGRLQLLEPQAVPQVRTP